MALEFNYPVQPSASKPDVVWALGNQREPDLLAQESTAYV